MITAKEAKSKTELNIERFNSSYEKAIREIQVAIEKQISRRAFSVTFSRMSWMCDQQTNIEVLKTLDNLGYKYRFEDDGPNGYFTIYWE